MWAGKGQGSGTVPDAPVTSAPVGGGGGAAMTRTGVHTGAGLTTVETCHKALVLLRPTALTAERVELSGVRSVDRGHAGRGIVKE